MQLYNLARMGLQTLAHNLTGKKCPVNVMLAVTNRCNANCHYCQIPSRPGDDIPLPKMLQLIDEMADAGTIRLGIWGGEPLVVDGIGEIVRHAKRRGMYVTMDSNGLAWRERHAELEALDHVTFALDGTRETHEANRGVGTYDRVKDAIPIAAGTEGLAVWTLTVLTKNNLQTIDTVIEEAEAHGIHCAFQILHHNDVMGTNHDDMMPVNEAYRTAIDQLISRKKQGAPIASSMRYLNYLRSWPDFQKPTQVEKHRGVSCKAGAMYCNVDADGAVYACSLMVGKSEAANALEVGFKKAFDSIPPIPCQGCSSACFTEYNHIYSLDPACILEWMKTTRHR
ncbi:MAG: radical SAM protein [Verrucomicrobia bacterium]|nr:radical SAM protein [Verrucomicrobiota bacterium]